MSVGTERDASRLENVLQLRAGSKFSTPVFIILEVSDKLCII